MSHVVSLISSQASPDLLPGLIAGYSNAIDHALVDRENLSLILEWVLASQL